MIKPERRAVVKLILFKNGDHMIIMLEYVCLPMFKYTMYQYSENSLNPDLDSN